MSNIAKYRKEGFPGEWFLTEFTMEQVEGRIVDIEAHNATLRAENERLKAEIVDRQGTEESLTKWVAELGEEVDMLKGEVERLRNETRQAKESSWTTDDIRHGGLGY